jgi:alanine-synthesizing transaminase
VTQFRRVDALPPYAFAEVERLKLELRRAGEDVIDFGFGNPDVAPPEVAVEKLREAALLPRNHRYSSSRGLPNLRKAVCERYLAHYGVDLDAETEATMSLGAKEGLVHLLWVLLGPGDVALVPSPSYPIHLFAPGFAGAAVQRVPVGPEVDFVAGVKEAWELSQPRPRVLLCSFPHNPTTAIADQEQMQQLVDFAREKEMVLVHDFAYADLAFDGYRPPSVFEADGAREVAVELYSMTKGFSIAGWRIAFVLGRSDVIGALARLKSYLDYGSFQPLQIAATVALREAGDRPQEVAEVYRGRRDALCDGLARIGWDVPRPAATMFVWARIPQAFASEGAQAFAVRLLREAHVAVSPGSGFGADGEGYVRFALVENEQRIAQAVRGLRAVLA